MLSLCLHEESCGLPLTMHVCADKSHALVECVECVPACVCV